MVQITELVDFLSQKQYHLTDFLKAEQIRMYLKEILSKSNKNYIS